MTNAKIVKIIAITGVIILTAIALFAQSKQNNNDIPLTSGASFVYLGGNNDTLVIPLSELNGKKFVKIGDQVFKINVSIDPVAKNEKNKLPNDLEGHYVQIIITTDPLQYDSVWVPGIYEQEPFYLPNAVIPNDPDQNIKPFYLPYTPITDSIISKFYDQKEFYDHKFNDQKESAPMYFSVDTSGNTILAPSPDNIIN